MNDRSVYINVYADRAENEARLHNIKTVELNSTGVAGGWFSLRNISPSLFHPDTSINPTGAHYLKQPVDQKSDETNPCEDHSNSYNSRRHPLHYETQSTGPGVVRRQRLTAWTKG